MSTAFAQDVTVGPVHVDTGSNGLDLVFALVLLAAGVAAAIAVRRWGR